MTDKVTADVDMTVGLVHFRVRRELDVVPFAFSVSIPDIKRILAGILLAESGSLQPQPLPPGGDNAKGKTT
jgi:hypothetical protein